MSSPLNAIGDLINPNAAASAASAAASAASAAAATATQIQSVSRELLAKIQGIHAPETHQANLKPVVQLIENIFHNADGAFKATHGILNGVASLDGYDGMTQVLDDIHKISCEMSCNHSGDLEKAPMELLETLKCYNWNAKLVIAVAAFAMIFGEFWLLVRLRTEDLFAKSLDLLRGYPQIPDFTVLNKLLKALMDVVDTNLTFLEPPICNISADLNAMKDAMAYLPDATYRIIHIVVRLSSILGKKVDYDIGVTISSLKVEVTKINVELQAKLELCKTEADKHEKEQYEGVRDALSSKVLTKIISIFMGIDELKIPPNLKNKHVVFLISDLEISIEEINTFKLVERDRKDYEIIWLPIVRLKTTQKKFTELKSKMTWTVVNPSQIAPAVIKFIKTEWHFIKNPIAVSMNAQGEVTCPNALPMLLTWGNDAFPFTAEKEKELWGKIDEQNGWKLDLLITEKIDRNIWSWGKSNETFVCLFGGDNPTWAQEFIAKVKEVATAASVSLKLAYVGSNKNKGVPRKQLGQDIQVIESEHRLLFWNRLESIFYSKIRLGKSSKTDRVMREVMRLLSYDGNGDEWAIFTMGSEVMVTANGDTVLTTMSKYKDWKREAAATSFLQGLKTYINKMPLVHACVHVNVPILGHIPGTVICPECSKEMEMYYAYRCCV